MESESAVIDGAVYTSPYGKSPHGNPDGDGPHGTSPSTKSLSMASSFTPKRYGSKLGNQTQLSKIDQLRDLQVGAFVALPQLVVVGDQSSGKSSVLEGLTGFSFPRASGLCTRYATQITCQRDNKASVAISIIPAESADDERATRLRAFQRTVSTHEADFAEIFEQANKTMGIRSIQDTNGNQLETSTFSEDILKIVVSGPDESHLTVIDVPGIFNNATPGLTTEDDIDLVRSMVKRYMQDSRTIILAVIPCNVDIATQEILKLASHADPEGQRTMGVLTKPDLAIEQAVKATAIDLLMGKRNDLQLGYVAVKNRGSDDTTSLLALRHAKETSFFQNEPWSAVERSKLGIEALKTRVTELLTQLSKREFVNVKMDMMKLLDTSRTQLRDMGAARDNAVTQRIYLGNLASSFSRLTGQALRADYTVDPLFQNKPDLRLITRILELRDAFSSALSRGGHTYKFETDGQRDELGWVRRLDFDPKDGDRTLSKGKKKTAAKAPGSTFWSLSEPVLETDKLSFRVPLSQYADITGLEGYVMEPYNWEVPRDNSLLDHIEREYIKIRGPEIGTFGGALLGAFFKEQSAKWDPITMSFISKNIAIVHHFIVELLRALVPDEQVRTELWDSVLLEALRKSYQHALDHTRWLLQIERDAQPLTCNQDMYEKFNKKRQQPADTSNNATAGATPTAEEAPQFRLELKGVALQKEKNDLDDLRERIHNILEAYYEISRKRFADVVCQQVVDHFLLNGPASPLRVLGPDLVMQLDDTQLEAIAGEDMGTRRRRQNLTSTVSRLEAALKILRG